MSELRAPIFHIIHGSFVDGYGIRTTVFLKGCPLKCIWCCNPEGQKFHPELKLSVKKCNGCGNCVPLCPVGAIKVDPQAEENKIQIDRTICTDCGKCVEGCFTDALEMFGESYTVEELFAIVEKDEQFYRSSGGGVTIGGGEATCYPEFVRELIRLCKEKYIHTAVDTCGFITSEAGFKALEEADLLLYDLKGMDPEEHLKNTGVSNVPILENLKRLNAMGKPIIVRVPIIPGYTDSMEHLTGVAELLATLKSVERVDLLPVHEFGKIKYEQLGKDYELHVQSIPVERQAEIKEFFLGYGLNAQIGG